MNLQTHSYFNLGQLKGPMACWTLVATLAVVSSLGCGKGPAEVRVPVYPVSAEITFKGEKMPGAFITFHPKNRQADVPSPRANVGPDGALRVSTYDGGDGAPEGEYVLTVQWNKLIKNGSDVVAGPNVVPKKYSAPSTSGLEVKVAAGDNNLPPIKL